MDEGGEEGEEWYQSKWEMLVELVHMAFRYGVLAEEATWQVVVLIPKGGGDYHVIGLVEVVWKAVAAIINRRFTALTTYHEYLHGFWAGRGMGTVTLEVKLLHQVTAMSEEILHTIFLYLHKAYKTSDRSRCLEILEGYGKGTRAICLLHWYWEKLQMVERAGGYYI